MRSVRRVVDYLCVGWLTLVGLALAYAIGVQLFMTLAPSRTFAYVVAAVALTGLAAIRLGRAK